MSTISVTYAEAVCPVLAQRRSRAWLMATGVCVIALLSELQARYALVWVVGDSMQPTICSSTLVLVSKLAYSDTTPCRDDLVVARCRKELIAKRIVGLPGERVGVKLGVLHIDGKAVAERHSIRPGYLTIEAGTLFAGRYALLGDNRDLTAAATVHAVVEKDQIVGKVVAQLPRLPLQNAAN